MDHNGGMSDWLETRGLVREFALGLPEAHEDFPWGETVVKVNKKVFVFLGTEGSPSLGVKLRESHGHALSVPGAAPSGYGLGRAGWVTIPFTHESPEPDLLHDWVEESYRLVAPKRLSALIRRDR